MDLWTEFHGPNAGYVLELYERFIDNPAAVDAQTRAFFEQWAPPGDASSTARGSVSQPAPVSTAAPLQAGGQLADVDKVLAVQRLSQAIRWYGHFGAQLDPLGSPPPGDPSLTLAYYDLQEEDLSRVPAEIVGGPAAAWARRQRPRGDPVPAPGLLSQYRARLPADPQPGRTRVAARGG
jgi:2-oxoglutarate dehydrogenase E1 component